MCFAAFGCRTQRCRHAGLHIRVKLAVHEGFLKLVPFIGAALFGFRGLPCTGHFLLCGDLLELTRTDQLIHLVLLDIRPAARMAVYRERRSDLDQSNSAGSCGALAYFSGKSSHDKRICLLSRRSMMCRPRFLGHRIEAYAAMA